MKTTDFLNEHNAFIAQEAGEMHMDHEVQMARADCYHAADYAIKLHKLLQQVKETSNLEGWVSEKITIANECLRTVYEYLSYEAMEQEEPALPSFSFESADKQFNKLLNEINPHNYDSDEDYYNDLHGDDEDEYDGDGEDDEAFDGKEEPESHYEKSLRTRGLGEDAHSPEEFQAIVKGSGGDVRYIAKALQERGLHKDIRTFCAWVRDNGIADIEEGIKLAQRVALETDDENEMAYEGYLQARELLGMGMAEARVGNRMSDMQIGSPKIVYYKGKAVGEVGIDHEASPGNGPFYMKHYLSGKDMVGYDTKKEALADLKHMVMQMNEGLADAPVSPETLQVLRQLRKQISVSSSLSAKKTMIVLKCDYLEPQDRQLVTKTLQQAGIQFKIKDNTIDTTRGSWTNTLVGIPFQQGVNEARDAATASTRAGLAKRKDKKPLSAEEQLAKDKAKSDKWLEKERAKVAAKKGVAEAKGELTYTQKQTNYGVVPDSKKEFVKKFKSKEEASAHAEKHGGKVVSLDQQGRRMKTVTEMTAGGTGAGGFATGPTAGGGKPGTGKPKKMGNMLKRTTPKIGTGIYK